MKTKNKIFILIGIFIVLLVIYIILDCNNFTSATLLDVTRINMDMLSIVVTNLVVIILYITTYFMVDEKKTMERINKKEIVKDMLLDNYETCLRYLKLLEDKVHLKNLVNNISTENINVYKNDYFNKWMDLSFKNYNDIMQYASQGIIKIDILKQYLYIKREYSSVMTGYVVVEGFPREVEKLIEEGHQKLKKVIENEIVKIKKLNCKE